MKWDGFTVIDRYERLFKDTPCAHCGHSHRGSDGAYAEDGNTPSFYERCGVWLSWPEYSAGIVSSLAFGPCPCPEWVQPPLCVCGRAWPAHRLLDGRRYCSLTKCPALVGVLV